MKQAVYHKSGGNYAYMLRRDTLRVVLRAAKDDAAEAAVVWYNRFHGEARNRVSLAPYVSDGEFDYFYADLDLTGHSCVYYFELTFRDGERLYFAEFGFTEQPPERVGSFEMLAMHASELYGPPDWVRGSVFYQIFPDRFFRAGKEAAGLTPWGQAPTYYTRFGGDLAGIRAKIDYLAGLGVNAVYLTPVFRSDSCHRYDTLDYTEIDPLLGSKEDMRALTEALKRKGIRVVLDAVFNHCSDDFFAFRDVKEKGEKSPYRDWFYIDGFPVREGSVKRYLTFADEFTMPRLNTENPAVADYLIGAARQWTKELCLDGWRLDVADEVSPTFWRRFRRELKAVNPDLFILGEIWHNGEQYLGDRFDSVMNYPFRMLAGELFGDAAAFRTRLTRQMLTYPFPYALAQFNLLDSHDTPRALTALGGDKTKLRQAAVLQFTYVGVPCLYYGDEAGMTGGDDPDCRRCMDFGGDGALRDFYCRLIALRKTLPQLAQGDFRWVDAPCVAYARTLDGRSVEVYINAGPESVPIPTGRGETLMSEGLSDVLAPGGYAIRLV